MNILKKGGKNIFSICSSILLKKAIKNEKRGQTLTRVFKTFAKEINELQMNTKRQISYEAKTIIFQNYDAARCLLGVPHHSTSSISALHTPKKICFPSPIVWWMGLRHLSFTASNICRADDPFCRLRLQWQDPSRLSGHSVS